MTAINDIHLDYYVMKPWEPPEERLYPILDELLDARGRPSRGIARRRRSPPLPPWSRRIPTGRKLTVTPSAPGVVPAPLWTVICTDF